MTPDILSFAKCTPQQAQLVCHYFFPFLSTFLPYHDERDVYENTLEITVSDPRVADDIQWLFLILTFTQHLHQNLFRPCANEQKTNRFLRC
jgi:hypothetical protein